MGTALVTGCPGWVGNRLLRHLRDPHPDNPGGAPDFDRIRVLVLPGTPHDELTRIAPDLEVVEGDVRDREAVRRFCRDVEGAVLFHVAGVMRPRRLRDFHDVNVGGTRNVLACAISAGVRRVVAVSSASTVERARAQPVVETTPYRPDDGYGRSKVLLEAAVRAAEAQHGLEAVIVRPVQIYGPEGPARQAEFLRFVRRGWYPAIGDGNALRSMCYVDSVVLGLLLAAAVPAAAGQTYFVADERQYTLDEYLRTTEDVLEHDFHLSVARRRLRLPRQVGDGLYLLGAALEGVGLYEKRLHTLGHWTPRATYSSAKARDELGFRPSMTLREGLRRSVEWLLAHGGQRI